MASQPGGPDGKLATNPRGFWRTKLRECRCRYGDVVRYCGRISGPLLDRIGRFVDVPSIDVAELRGRVHEESSATVRDRVEEARARRERNGDAPLTEDAKRTLLKSARSMALPARGISRCVGVARTIASLAGAHPIGFSSPARIGLDVDVDKSRPARPQATTS